MNIVIGLGNPGNAHAQQRHNVGWMVLDALTAKEGLHFNEQKIFHAAIASFGPELLLAKPDTFMNDSGQAAAMLVKQYSGSVVVVYDDIDINLGDIQCSFNRGAGGHNGVQSVIDHLDTKNFLRIRVGVRPVHEELLPRIAPPDGFEKYLLSDFAPVEEDARKEGIAKAVAIISDLPNKKFEEIMNKYN